MLYMCVTSISIGFHLNGASVAKTNGAQMAEIFRLANYIHWMMAKFRRITKNRKRSMLLPGADNSNRSGLEETPTEYEIPGKGGHRTEEHPLHLC